MNEGLTHSLIIAKALLDQATRQIKSGDRYLGTAGLMFLQDGLEIIFVALLIDEGTKESAKKAIERRSFDELMGDLNAQGIHIPRTGHLSLLNKQRVQAKHYGLIVDSESAHAYLQSAELAIDTLLKRKLGRGFETFFCKICLQRDRRRSF